MYQYQPSNSNVLLHNGSGNGVRYLEVETVMRGKGPERLKYLDINGVWTISGISIPYISTAFRHLEALNFAKTPLRAFTDEPLNAIRGKSWTPSEMPKGRHEEVKKVMAIEKTIESKIHPPPVRESIPHRSVGYGSAHEARKMKVKEDLSRSLSPKPSLAKPMKGEIETKEYYKGETDRKQKALQKDYTGSRIRVKTPLVDDRIRPSENRYTKELEVQVRNVMQLPPYRSGGYGDAHIIRQFDISPKSAGYAGSTTKSPRINSVVRSTPPIQINA